MGQYYNPTNLDKKQYLYSHEYGSGLKLMEHSYIGNPMLNVIEKLLAEGGDWYKAPIVWAGDYADEGKFVPAGETVYTEEGESYPSEDLNVYAYVIYAGERITPGFSADPDDSYQVRDEVAAQNERDPNLNYICNWDKLQYVDLNSVQPIGDEGWEAEMRIHPLSLLTADGNGRGGGDFHGQSGYVGTWAGDRISVENTAPTGFVQIQPNFKEV